MELKNNFIFSFSVSVLRDICWTTSVVKTSWRLNNNTGLDSSAVSKLKGSLLFCAAYLRLLRLYNTLQVKIFAWDNMFCTLSKTMLEKMWEKFAEKYIIIENTILENPQILTDLEVVVSLSHQMYLLKGQTISPIFFSCSIYSFI